MSRFCMLLMSIICTSLQLHAQDIYQFKVAALDGSVIDFSIYKGKKIIIVNVASKCGFTPQYEGLEKLYKELKGQNFNILGFPSNDFGGQEPGTAEEIQ